MQMSTESVGQNRILPSHSKSLLRGNRFRKQLMPWLFIAPITLLHLMVVVGPSLSGAYYSLTEWSGIGDAEFVGLQNFQELFFEDRNFRIAFQHNIYWLAFFVTVPFIVALAVATLLAQVRRGAMAMRTAFLCHTCCPVLSLLSFGRCSTTPNWESVPCWQILEFLAWTTPIWAIKTRP